MNLLEWFDKGITKEAYIERLDNHREAFLNIYNKFTIPTEDKQTLAQLKNIRIIALAEEWCGHCMLDIPILLTIAEQANIPIRFLPRDNNLELMDHYLTNEKRFIPIFIFIDENGNQLYQWGPMAPEIAAYVNDTKTTLPEKDAINYKEAFKTYISTLGKAFATDKTLWNYVYQDILNTINIK